MHPDTHTKNQELLPLALLAIGLALLLAALLGSVGCSHIQSVGVSGGYAPATGTASGALTIGFKTRAGQPAAVSVSRAIPRGVNTAGDYVTLGTLRQLGILAYREHRNTVELGRAYGLNVFDIETVGVIKTLLTQANADPATL